MKTKYTVLGIVIGFLITAGFAVRADVLQATPNVPAFVGEMLPLKGLTGSYTPVAKIYDPYDKVVCYETGKYGYTGDAISCVQLK